MSLQLNIPDSVVSAIRIPEQHVPQALLRELAVALYAQAYLSFGKARELADMRKYEFGHLLGERGIARHYEEEDLRDDIAYARGE